MIPSRRSFLAAAAAAFALDPERALWVRGAKLISIPRPRSLAEQIEDWRFVRAWTEGQQFTPSGILKARDITPDLDVWIRRKPPVGSVLLKVGDTVGIRRPARFEQSAGGLSISLEPLAPMDYYTRVR